MFVLATATGAFALAPHPWAHPVFEALAYVAGFAVYRRLRAGRGDVLSDSTRATMILAVVVGAIVGSKLLHHSSHPLELSERWREPAFVLGGKTIVGALLGGWLAVELVKRARGIRRATGDLYALPLCVGMFVGRLGCFLAGPRDGTHGAETGLPWAVDYGDGVARHPAPLYEMLFLAGLAFVLWRRARARRGPAVEGDDFLLFLGAYLAFRFLVDFLKPAERWLGVGGIQWACLVGLAIVLGTAVARRAVLPVGEGV